MHVNPVYPYYQLQRKIEFGNLSTSFNLIN
jgi:hypothetical protein